MRVLAITLSVFSLLAACSKSEPTAPPAADQNARPARVEVLAEPMTPQWLAPQKGDHFWVEDNSTLAFVLTVETERSSDKKNERETTKKEYEVSVLEVEQQAITEVEVEFGAYVENGKTRTAQGRSYRVSFENEKIAKIVRSSGESVLAFEADYVRKELRSLGRANPIERRIAGSTLQPGDPIELNDDDRKALVDDERLEGELTMVYRGVVQREGQRLGVIGIEGSLTGSKEGINTTMKLEGDGIFEPSSGRMLETTLGADLLMSGRTMGRIVKGSGTLVGTKRALFVRPEDKDE